MLVKYWMSKNVVTVDVGDSMQDAMKRMKENDIRMLPVLKKGKLVGVVTDRDLKRASASDATTLDVHELLYLVSKIKVQNIMTKNPITVPQNFTVEETAEVLLKYKISGAPVATRTVSLSEPSPRRICFGSSFRSPVWAKAAFSLPSSLKIDPDPLRRWRISSDYTVAVW